MMGRDCGRRSGQSRLDRYGLRIALAGLRQRNNQLNFDK